MNNLLLLGFGRLGSFVLLENTGFEQFVDELLHAVVGGKETLRRHDDTAVGLRNRSFAILFGLKSNKVIADHAAGEVDLTDAVCVDFFFVVHFFIPFFYFSGITAQ